MAPQAAAPTSAIRPRVHSGVSTRRIWSISAALAGVAAHGGQDQAFGIGLVRILDGLERLVTTRV
ncbi:hypothetical protein [Actinoplanes siamensis]|uniref:Uncharacterized protein n=1 Tax=Actinoplanes siamensis TaxID=1223317 RepID=A0A919N3B8_9ACTN|nr:hypothetical protein [Actinoplanes siamensis]GIF03619.1 hypothetical protein Asi03nite_11570 [Actinoplanes siamensis]